MTRGGAWHLIREAGLRPVQMVWIALSVASVFTVLFTIQGVLMLQQPTAPGVLRVLGWQAIPWFLWAALAVPVFWLIDRVDPGGRALGMALGLHLALGCIVAFLHVVLLTALTAAVGLTADGGTFPQRIVWLFQRNAFTGMVHYTMLALAYHLVRMVAQYRRSQETVRRREEQLATARLEALQRQLHPHFLFNALNAASAAARTGNGRDAARLIAALGDLLRGAIDLGDRPEVRLEEELAFLERFLFIQRVRFDGRLTATLAIAPETRSAAVPPLLVETLVENAIKHGIEYADRPATIGVRSTVENGRLRLVVENDGPAPRPHALGAERGTGIRNARARLRELYGNDASLSLAARDGGGGARAVVELPFHTPRPDPGPRAAPFTQQKQSR